MEAFLIGSVCVWGGGFRISIAEKKENITLTYSSILSVRGYYPMVYYGIFVRT